MKKILVALLLSIVSVNAFGMQVGGYDYRVELAKQNVEMIKVFTYPIFGAAAVIAGGYFGYWMWSDYMDMRTKSHQASLAAKVPVVSQPSSWAPYAKLAAGVGLTGLSVYLGCKQTPQPQSMVNTITNTNEPGDTGVSSTRSTILGNSFSPNIMISFASAYTLAPMVPAYFLLKSGYEDLKAERDLAYHKEHAKTELTQIPANGPAQSHV